LLGHVFLDHVHGHVARAFVHDLHAFGPRAAGEFALHFEFAELRLVVGVGNRAGTESVALMPMMIQFNWVKTFQIQLALKFSVNSVKAIKPQSASALNQIRFNIFNAMCATGSTCAGRGFRKPNCFLFFKF